MKAFCLFLLDALLLFMVGLAALIAIFTSCGLIVMLIVRFQDGRLLDDDLRLLALAAKWWTGSVIVIGGILWLRRRTIPASQRAGGFRGTVSRSQRAEERIELCSYFMIYAVFAFLAWGVTHGSPFVRSGIVIIALAAAFAGLHLHILIHELGHLLAATALRFDRYKIQIGTGPVAWSRLFNSGLLFQWRAFPRAGYVRATSKSDRHFRFRQLLFILAGPLADLFVIFTAYKLIHGIYGGVVAAYEDGPVGFVAVVLFWWIAWCAFCGFIPRKVWISGCEMWTDSYWILLLCFASPVRLRTLWFDRRKAFEMLKSESNESESEFVGNDPSNSLITFQQQRNRLASLLLGKQENSAG